VSDELSVGFKVDKYINGITRIPGGLYANSAFLIINKEKWNKISKTDREAISAISGEVLSERMGRLWHKNDLAAQDQLKGKLGDKYLVADKALLDVIDQAFEPARQRWYEEAGAAGVDGQAAMQFYREQVSQLSDQLAQTGSPGQ
jgi:TRAP-type C4-dicarboxylate transport system substrate-binding protein